MTRPAKNRRPIPLVVLCGPTASGKTGLAVGIAQRSSRPCEIVSADSVQVYRGLDIGSAKPTDEEKKSAPHHLIDIRDPDQTYSAAEFAADAHEAIESLHREGKRILVVGGTGLYLRALLEGVFEEGAPDEGLRRRLQEEIDADGAPEMHRRLETIDLASAQRIHPNDSVRVRRAMEVALATGEPLSAHHARQGASPDRYRALKLGLDLPRAALYERINLRVDRMREEGLIDEVRRLKERGYGPNDKALGAIGYKEALAFLAGEIDEETCWDRIKTHSRRLAKRQLTWYRPDQEIQWIRPGEEETIALRVEGFFQESERE